MNEGKSFQISQESVLEAYKRVKANKGAAGVDRVNFEDYEKELKNNLYKLWNRMSSGSYFPKAVRGVEIPKKNGKKRLLGIPTIEDRVAQMVTRMVFEPDIEKIFLDDSYGYRPNRSSIDAIRVTRERCWKYGWVLEFDIVGLFDNINHDLLMRAVKVHTNNKWVVLYIERFLKASMVMPDRSIKERTAGTPQCGVISPVLANLFMHYAFDNWMKQNFPANPWARYADDGIVHCVSEKQAKYLLYRLMKQMKLCGLEIHPDKTRIVYCRSDKFQGTYECTSFDFLGYTFRTRYVKSKNGNYFNAFTPAVSKESSKMFRSKIKDIRLNSKTISMARLAELMNPIIRGWMNYFMVFGSGEARKSLDYINVSLVKFVHRKYKGKGKFMGKSWRFLGRWAKRNPSFSYHWEKGIVLTIG